MAAFAQDPVRSRTILWCVPRSASTALTLCLSGIDGLEVWFEPFLHCHIAEVETRLQLGRELPLEYLDNEDTYLETSQVLNGLHGAHFNPELISYPSIKRKLETVTSQHVLVKDIALGSVEEIRHLPDDYRHSFLIRHPLRTASSYRKAMIRNLRKRGQWKEEEEEDLYDFEEHEAYFSDRCFGKDQYDIWKYVRENIDENPVVIDGDDLLAEPAKVVSAYCQAVGLPHDEKLLKWDNSFEAVKAWKCPAHDLPIMNQFFETAMGSSEFKPANPMPRRDQLTPDVIRCADQVMKYYEEMYESRMKCF